MLRVTVQIFSGRPNPTWVVTDEDAAGTLLETVARAAGDTIGLPGAGYDGLGYREVVVSSASDDMAAWPERLPQTFALGTIAAADPSSSAELARRLIADMPQYGDVTLVEHAQTPVDTQTRDFVLEQLDTFFENPPAWNRVMQAPPQPPERSSTQERDAAETCWYEVSQFNPDFWNRPEVQPRNNCYNYARNHRTDTFAQPGRAHGAQTSNMACASVTKAALADGLVHRYHCLPDSEKPRRLMALAVWPGWDYHWYREQKGDFWGHKPGGTAARNYDNRGALITNPETCDRGGYTDFCGYFYAGRSVVIN
ncbi:hypothetical protein [Streptomyces purpurascens]|uniref:Uncharacterized protein n=1 Tax=Streptomyces purpurascens TaxID=1924 RepID=A0ABZ1MUE2_STREF|nr:hypothetical protein [Streptomyces purpurascens]MCE7045866.1 hypothetical protein [Streptomyces purpurascens]GGZ97000.1 hypothetical protein GCM10010303_02030 [Streptomyces purpurascens]